MPSPTFVVPSARKEFLDRCRHLKMARSAHAYVRGNTLRFYEWLEKGGGKTIPSGPPIWICGDCHIGNLGPIADVEGRIEILIRDLDQTVIGNPAHDLLRLGLSLAMAARSSDLPGVTTALMIERMLEGYLEGLAGRQPAVKPGEIQPIQTVMRSAVTRKWRNLAEEHIEDVTPRIPLGRKLWPLTREEEAALTGLFDEERQGNLARHLTGAKPDAKVRLLDAAFWMKGCSSLGRIRYAALLAIGKRKEKRYSLVDVKEATRSVVPAIRDSSMPQNNAARVVAGARQLSPSLGDRMVAAKLLGKDVVVRELRPQDLKFEFSTLSQAEALLTARLLAGVVGKAHGRQLKRADRSAWARELNRRHTKDLHAPSWLWSAVVELAAAHEAAYLCHCREFALASAK